MGMLRGLRITQQRVTKSREKQMVESHRDIVRGGCVGRSLPAPLLAALLLHNDHPADTEAVGDHAEALGEKCLAERHSYLSTVGERVEHAVGLGFVLGIDGEREALEFGFALRAAV